jgi:predicted dinucleotide-binding enzyme
MKIGIIGSGKMGTGLGRLWAQNGHYVMFSYSRRPEKLQDLVREIGSHARSGSTEDAVRYGDVVLLAAPGPQWATPFPTPDRWTGRYLSVASIRLEPAALRSA